MKKITKKSKENEKNELTNNVDSFGFDNAIPLGGSEDFKLYATNIIPHSYYGGYVFALFLLIETPIFNGVVPAYPEAHDRMWSKPETQRRMNIAIKNLSEKEYQDQLKTTTEKLALGCGLDQTFFLTIKC